MTIYEAAVYGDLLSSLGLLVLIPLFLLFASLGLTPVRRRLLVYWRAAALLGITAYLWIGEVAMGFATGVAARAIIPLALWRGDAFTVLRDQPVPDVEDWRVTLFRYWRVAAIVYLLAGLTYMLPLLSCAVSGNGPLCQAWYRPPQAYADWLHPNTERIWLARYAWVALGVYAAYLLSTAVRLQRDLMERRTRSS